MPRDFPPDPESADAGSCRVGDHWSVGGPSGTTALTPGFHWMIGGGGVRLRPGSYFDAVINHAAWVNRQADVLVRVGGQPKRRPDQWPEDIPPAKGQ